MRATIGNLCVSFVQEAIKHERLREELELKSTERESKMHEAFVKALETQQTTEEKASALKDELAKIARNSQLEIDALTEQVDLHDRPIRKLF